MFILQAIKPRQLSLSKWLTPPSEDVIEEDRSILFCPWHFPHCIFKGLQLNHFLPRNINSCALLCFSGADTGEENKAREDQRVNRCHCWACRAQARCAIVKIHSTSVLLMTFDPLPFMQRAEVFRTNGVMKSFPARSSRNTRQEAFLEQFFC